MEIGKELAKWRRVLINLGNKTHNNLVLSQHLCFHFLPLEENGSNPQDEFPILIIKGEAINAHTVVDVN